ncbi:MAG: hypothetical protein H7Z41_09470 [Cytophagales bacterium]|nr:hypothetical protein [Armatimonadota bacterium]
MVGIIFSILVIIAIAAGIVWPLFRQRQTDPVPLPLDGDAVLRQSEVAVAKPVAGGQRTLEQLCPHCSSMNSASRTICRECENPLPVQSFSGFLGANKQETIRELTQAGLLLTGMILIIVLSGWLPPSGKIALIVGTLALLGFRLNKHISGD